MKKFLIVLPFIFSLSIFSADWPKWLGPNNDGVSTESDWGNDLDNLQWKTKIGVGFSSMVVADGRLFTMGHDGQKRGGKETVYCLDAKTGKPIWTDSYPAPMVDYLHEGGPCATPTVDGNLVYAISKHGKLGAYQAGTGKKVWSKDMMVLSGLKKIPEWGFAASPYVLENLLLIEAGATYALNKLTGEIVWKSQDYRPAYGSPISFKSGKDTHVAAIKTDGLVILDGSNGKTLAFEKWETSYRTNASTPIIKGDKIFISTGYRRGCALFQWNGNSLSKIYENKNLSTHMNHAILVDDYLYGFDGNVHMAGPKDFACIQFSTGKEQWRVTDRGLQVGSLLVAGDRMLMLGQRGEGVIARVNPEKFEVLNREQIIGGKTWTMPILANGLLYVRNARGDLFCLGLSK
jgi:outer membrane protein assembly factor BamB